MECISKCFTSTFPFTPSCLALYCMKKELTIKQSHLQTNKILACSFRDLGVNVRTSHLKNH